MNLEHRSVLVVDHGIFLPIAQRLAKDFGTVYYHTPWEKAFPTVRDVIGDGFENIRRVDSIWQVVHNCDLVVFPDIGFAHEQRELKRQGFPVWGPGDSDRLEISRGYFLKMLETVGLPIVPHEKVKGLNALREHLRELEDKWIKVSKYRGDWETMHWRSWAQDETTLDALAVKLGTWKEHFTFYVFDSIDTEIEDGCDTTCILGQWPSLVLRGMERKDKAYLGTFQKFTELPGQLTDVFAALGPVLGRNSYQSFFSIEVRVTEDGTGYFIDPTCRAGSPPSQVQTELIGNYSEMIWKGAHGKLVDPEPTARFGVQVLLTVKADRKSQWVNAVFREELSQWVKCGFCSQVDGGLVVPPEAESTGNDIGWIIGIGDSIKEAVEHLHYNMAQLPDGICADACGIADLIKEVDKAEEAGMEFTDQPVPKPEIVLEEKA